LTDSDQLGRSWEESAMKNKGSRHRPASSELHPLLYWAMAGLAFWFAAAAWLFFSSGGYTDLALGIVSLFLLITVAIPFVIFMAWRGSPVSGEPSSHTQTFRDWVGREFEIWEGRVSGKEAAIEILLPLVAVALGLTLFGVVLHLDVAVPS
jgi:hypothetical protein